MTPKEVLEQAFGIDAVSQIEDWDAVDKALTDPATGQYLRENIVGFKSILRGTRHTINDYINACRFCCLVTSGATDIDAFHAVFPDRFKFLTQPGKSANNLGSGIRAYKRTFLVQRIMEQVRVPLYLLHADQRVRALNTLCEIMEDEDVHPRDRVAAASSLATQLAPPKEALHKVEITNNQSDDIITQLVGTIGKFVDQQQLALNSGKVTVAELGQTKIIDHDSQ